MKINYIFYFTRLEWLLYNALVPKHERLLKYFILAFLIANYADNLVIGFFLPTIFSIKAPKLLRLNKHLIK